MATPLSLIKKCLENKEPVLDLGNLGLTDSHFKKGGNIDKTLRKCTHLKKFILGTEWWELSRTIWHYKTSVNKGKKNILANVPPAVSSLTKLSTFICCGTFFDKRWAISNISFVEGLTKLTHLDLSYNQIKEIKGFEKLTQLKYLFLGGNQIKVIKGLDNLKNLHSLMLYENQIKEITGIGNLINLKEFNINVNKIESTKEIENLKNLEYLSLGRNQIKEVNNLGGLQKLKSIDLGENKISEIKGVEKLAKLESINLSSNKISDLSLLLPLIKHGSPLKIVFKKDWLNVKNEINLHYNPLTTPPVEIAKQGNEAILHYFNELKKQGSDYLYEAKMLIVGQPRAGKTSLRYKLFDVSATLPEEDKTTRGIDIKRLEFPITDKDGRPRTFHYNIWDFGGQQIYQTTHQFFLTHRSLYVLVMDTGKDSIGNDDTTINYWLQAVELLGGNSPLLLVQNEKNERKINIDLPQKRARFNFLKDNYTVDLNALIPGTPTYKEFRLEDFNKLKEDIETELKRLPLVGFAMPKNWVKIREELQTKAKEHPYISRQDYIEICNHYEVTDFERQMELSRIFHDLGVFLHFQDYGALEEFIILQNVWATDAVFAVLDNEKVKTAKGKFTDNDLVTIWKDKGYQPGVHKKLLALMMQFELCYEVDKGQYSVYIVPELLAEKADQDYIWEANNDLPIQYKYDFMPKGLITRLIVRLHKHIHIYNNKQSVWKSGVKIDGTSLACPNTFAEISEAWDNKQLTVRIQGKFSKDLMNKITYEVDALNNAFFKTLITEDENQVQKSRWFKMIPCTCEVCSSSDDKHFYDYIELLERRDFGKDTIECKRKPYETVTIKELIDGVFAKTKTKQSSQINNNPKKLFISYAHADEKWKNKLVKNLSSLRNQELISDWNDREIEAGQWDPQIEAAMENTDIFLLLITANFLGSKYITTKEITKAYSLYKEGRSKIFPIICDSCEWQLQPITKKEKEKHPVENKEMYIWLGKFQPFPKDGKPIKNWNNPQDGFLDTINQLKKYL